MSTRTRRRRLAKQRRRVVRQALQARSARYQKIYRLLATRTTK